MDFEAIAEQYLDTKEVVYITSDGLAFYELHFAKSHANSKGLQVHTFHKKVKVEEPILKQPTKKQKNATK